jgi:ribokinase
VFDVVVLGSANLDLVATAPRIPRPGETVLGTSYTEHPGGKGLNQAVAAARAGSAVAFVGCVGDDDAGRRLRHEAGTAGVDVGSLRTLEGQPTGRALIVVDGAAENAIVVVPGANVHVVAGDVPPTRLLLAQLEVPVEVVLEAFRAARRAGTRTVLNPAPAAPLPGELLALCDVVVPNEHEVELIGGVSALLEQGVGAVVVTRGASGVTVTTPEGSWHEGPFPVDPVDTTGAGDAFCGVMAARLATDGDLRMSVRWGAAAGALATTRSGAVPSLPLGADVEALVTSR